jgi:hypothetical protein
MSAREMEPTHWLDEPETWTCRECERVFTDDTKVENHPKYNACICHDCLPQWLIDNEP